MAISANQARALTDDFLDAAQAIDSYLEEHFNCISRSEYECLNESFKTLMRISTFTTTVAVDLAIDSLSTPIAELNRIIQQAKEKIRTLNRVSEIIQLASALTDLAAGFVAKKPSAIASSAKNLTKLLTA
ncbi:hypothetical protein [Zooshikella harenae]|uniref:Uncharacterized protein n=1 Tax=Zooshikella harenae TaxID=2827238 RepID=A0ABS5ZHN5_9GAMM|nr:hypothetical protein [Zooshikella harenae]MBU2713552.1 hypothetical protein [Zooshikella harenae]